MLPNPNQPRPRRPKYRPINPADTVATTGNLVNPVGSITPVYTDYSSASYGGQGLFGSGLPMPNLGASGNLPGYYGTAGTPMNQRFTSPTTGFIQYGNPFQQNAYKPPATQSFQVTSYNPAIKENWSNDPRARETNTSVAPGVTTGSFNPLQVLDAVQQRLASGASDPINAADADALGLTEVLNDPNSGWIKNDKGQYVQDQASQSRGASPFGANEQGTRLDAFGNVWDPTTATRDIYGHAFKGSGQAGRNARKDYWDNLKKNKLKQQQKLRQQKASKETDSGFISSFGVVSFNTDSG